MQAALARKPEEKKSHAAPEPREAPELSADAVTGASAGMPLFLRRWSGGPPPVQRQEAPESLDEEEEKEQDKEEPAVQAKLEVNEPGDVWEQEADGVASAVMRKEEQETRLHGTPRASSANAPPVPPPDRRVPSVRKRKSRTLSSASRPPRGGSRQA